jgi:hypothetical protein
MGSAEEVNSKDSHEVVQQGLISECAVGVEEKKQMI